MRYKITPTRPVSAQVALKANLTKRPVQRELRELKQAIKTGALTAQQEKRLLLLIINELLGEDS